MRKDLEDLLNKHNIRLELKGYKEAPSTDGYFMTGNLYVNGKKAINFTDGGYGGECEIEILDKNNAKPLLDIKKEIADLKAYPDDQDEKMREHPLDLDDVFYTMAEELLEKKDLVKKSKKKILLRFLNKNYSKGGYDFLNRFFDAKGLKNVIAILERDKVEKIQVFNFENKWIDYSVEELKEKLKTLN